MSSHGVRLTSAREVHTTWSEFACPANQHPESTVKKKAHNPLRTPLISPKTCLPCLIIIRSCYFDYRINKPFICSRWVICVSCSVHSISTYYVCQGSWAFYLNYPQINSPKIRSRGMTERSCFHVPRMPNSAVWNGAFVTSFLCFCATLTYSVMMCIWYVICIQVKLRNCEAT